MPAELHLSPFALSHGLRHVAGETWNPSTPTRVALSTVIPAVDEHGGVTWEAPTAGGYAHQALSWNAASDGEATSDGAVSWTLTERVDVAGLVILDDDDEPIAFGTTLNWVTVADQQFTIPDGGIVLRAVAADPLDAMQGLSVYRATKMLDRLLRGEAWTITAASWAVATTDVDQDGTFTEATGGGYAREAASFAAPDVYVPVMVTDAVAEWTPLSTAAATDVAAIVLLDDTTGGNVLGAFPYEASVPQDENLSFDAGEIRVGA